MLVDAHPPARITSAPVSSASPEPPPPGAPTLCLGEALVDLVCERPLDDVSAADAFVAAFRRRGRQRRGGRRPAGAHVALAGGAGDDAWGRWLRARLQREGVDTSLFALVAGIADAACRSSRSARGGEPSYHIYGEKVATVADVSATGPRGRGPRLGRAVHQL